VKRGLIIPLVAMLTGLAGCQTVGRLTVRDYTLSNGEHAAIGQAEPEDAYQCTLLAREQEEWGLTGNMDQAAAMERMREVALENMSRKNANYGYLEKPSEFGVMGFNVNAFRDAKISYYRCNNLPAKT
jgi:hypothetical protein